MSSSMNVATLQPLCFSRRLFPSPVSRGLASSVTVTGFSGRRSTYAPSLRLIKCVSVSPEASIVSDTKKLGDASKSTNLIPIYRCIFSDQLTPVLAYRCLEDVILREQITQHGTENWAIIASKLKDKSTRQCRRRWYTYLNSDFKRGGWSPEEDLLLCEAQRVFGNRWTEIAKVVSGR